MNKDAQLTLAMPDRPVQVADLNRAHADPAPGAPQALELRHLRYFVALADAGNFTRAAEKIFIAQPTLSQQIRRLEEIVGAPLVQRRREGLRLTTAGRVLVDASRNVLALVDQEVGRTRQAAGLGRPSLRVVMPPGMPECLAVPATAGLQEAAAAADVDLAWLETVMDAEFSLISTRRADAGLGWLAPGRQTVPDVVEVLTVSEFEPEVWVPSTHIAARRGTISLEELAALPVIHGPRRAQPGTYDAWLTVIQAVDPRFEFTDPPFRHSLAMTLALAAAGNRPAAVLTGPAVPQCAQAWPIVRRSRLADTYGMVRVILQHHPLTASAALVWNGDLPRPLQQMLFDTADSLTEQAHPQPAGLISLTTA
jgi:DNA-binding transcriptional LysR family regulator